MRDPFLVLSQSYSPPSGLLRRRPPPPSYAHPRGQDSPLIAVAAVIVVVLIALSVMGALWLCWRKAMAWFCPTWTPFPQRRSFSVQAPVLDDQLMPIPTGNLESGAVLEALVRAVVPIPIGNLYTGAKEFSYEELATASDNFSDMNILGEGGFGKVYKGKIRESKVAIKKLLNASSELSVAGFVAEVTTLSRLHHRNVVPLIGYCQHNNELLIVYELVPNGSLDKHLHDPEKPVLPWWRRHIIALQLASALAYIHEDFDPDQSVLHKDIKPSNIMVGNNFDVRLGDFGLARFIDQDQSVDATNAAGTYGYMDPAPFSNGREDVKSDMYSFGVILLEMASGRPCTIEIEGEWSHIKDLLLREYRNGEVAISVADPRLEGNFVRKQLNAMIRVGLSCVHQEPRMRPSAKEALKALKSENSLEIPVNTPVNTYGSSVSGSSIFVNTSCASSGSLDVTGRRDGTVFSAVPESPSIADTRDFHSDRSSLSDNTSGLSSDDRHGEISPALLDSQLPADLSSDSDTAALNNGMVAPGSLDVTGRRDGTVFSAVPESPSIADTPDFHSDHSSLSDNTSGLSSDDSDREISRILLDSQLPADLSSDSYTAALNNGVVAPGSLDVTGRRDGTVSSAVPESPSIADTPDFHSDRSSLSDNTSGLSSDDSDGEISPALLDSQADLSTDSYTAALNNGVVAPVPSPKLATRRQKVFLEENLQKVEIIDRFLAMKASYTRATKKGGFNKASRAKYLLGHSPPTTLQTWREAFNLEPKAKEE